MQIADLWTEGSRPARVSGRTSSRTPTDLARRLGARSVHFDLLEQDRDSWGWALRNAYGEEVARSHIAYPSRVQASAAAVAFSRLVAEAGRQVGGR
ncbi:hypothetical protein GCM10007884_15650 [Methylobacterium brachythecii]|uniref:Uncharacterized protein n=1 Tax=Methylobacterium brachythecii TaxID=1176177 RepID=A0ABQ6D0M1_9HYPH|nr:hypothetical protein GCM10007884_15650 [Methylobacterium brachythecii]